MNEKKEDYWHSKKFNRFLHDEERRLKNSIIKIFAAFFLILISLNSYQILRLTQTFDGLKEYQQGVVDEVGEMKGGLMNFGNDLNEIRRFLYLPTRDYLSQDNLHEDDEEGVKTGTQVSQALYTALSEAADQKEKDQHFAQHCALIKEVHEKFQSDFSLSNALGQSIEWGDLIQNEESCSFKVFAEEMALYNLLSSYERNEGIWIQSALGEESFTLDSKTEERITHYFTQHAQELLDLKQSPENQEELNQSSDEPESIELKQAELEAIFKEKAFQELLRQNEFTLDLPPKEERGRLLYEVKHFDQVAFSIALDLESGAYRLLKNHEDFDLLSILHSTGEEKKNLVLPETLPEFGDSPRSGEGLTILVAGKHGNLVDTIMVVRLAEGRISIVSVPRDLYWNSRKINSIYAFYGMDEMVRILSDLSGYQIDHYALIDMFAFIEVVDMLGCLDVTLEKTLIDPSYKTLDNGVWGTLYYPEGTHHLCGKQALRVARSRYTSSDFSRAERQHIIMEALKNRAKEIGIREASQFKDLALTILKHIETDLNPAQALAYYFRFKDFEMNRGHVLSSGNVLDSTYTGEINGPVAPKCHTNEEGEEVCQAVKRVAYILLPRNGNWNNIKWFFQQAFEKGGDNL